MVETSFINPPKLLSSDKPAQSRRHSCDSESIQFWYCHFDSDLYRIGDERRLGVELPLSLTTALAKRKAEFLAGRCCARSALVALDYAVQPPGYNPDRSPSWPKGIHGSISHSDGMAIAAVSRDAFIGIDVETQLSDATAVSIADMILTESERQTFRGNGDHIDALTLTLIFSLKESFYKAAYPKVQRFFDFSALSVTAIDPVQQQITFKLEQTLTSELSGGLELQGYWQELSGLQYLTWVLLDNT